MDINLLWSKTKKYIFKKANKYKLKSFYISQTKGGKTLIAREVDRLFLSIIIFISLSMFFIVKSKNIYLSVIISLLITISFFILIKIKKYKELEKSKVWIKENIVIDMIYNELLNKSPEEFMEYFFNMFKDLKFVNLFKSQLKDFNIELEKDYKKIAVKTLQYTRGYDVNEEIVREFFMDLRRNNFDEGIIITTTDYTEEANNLLKKIDKHMKIYLINMRDIVKILKETSMFPKEKDIEGYILNKLSKEKKNISEYSNNLISPSKWKKYFVSGLVLWIFGQFTNFYIYYLIVSIILISLGLVSLIKKIILSTNGYKKEEDNKYAYDFIYKE
ncbi:restriction endonuclease [Clostridium sp. D2Q-11]|uniref:Restriction endonuclease n=1 Tax=Anaeromonas frigoriresistens TaxID=2683708 RepID=A0A942UWY0_9FIRM|nr:restriction endonuclease [Anaeromonas frigoriresistens]MBS4540118.1 restriction endonuclease [Anaeromonas frigoriresistens]